jgi:DNA-binding CsgD family transcriptional regulator
MGASNLHLVDDDGRPLPQRVVTYVQRIAPIVASRFSIKCDPAELSNSLEHEAQKISRVEPGKSDESLRRLTWRGLINGAINAVRKTQRRREDSLSSDALRNLTGIKGYDPETELILAERRQALLAALANLSERDQKYLRLRAQQFSDADIAAHMNLSKSALAQLKHRLKLRLIAQGVLPK